MDDSTREVFDLLNEIVEQISQESSTDCSHWHCDPEEGVNEGTKFNLIQMQDGVYVFNHNDIRKLRRRERILGVLCGPNQNAVNKSRQAPPLRLRPEEVRVLISNGEANLVSPSNHETVPPEEKRKAFLKFQQKLLEHANYERFRDKLETLCLFRGGRKPKKTLLDPKEVPFQPTPFDEKNPYVVQLVDTPFKVFERITQLSTSLDPISEIKYKVFAHLWQEGNFVTADSNFSSDFLVYKGDPSCYHAYACVFVLPPDGTLSALDIIRHCRIGSSVRKKIVIASVIDGDVRFVTLNWEA